MIQASIRKRVVFMGTPEFAVASLQAMISAGFNVVAVVTAPDRPAGRGMKLTMSAVKQYALEHQLPVLQPDKLRDPSFLNALGSLQADIQVVVAFRMLPDMVWNMPPMGTINVHASLLPQYRGAAPINWVVINGEQRTGITTFKLAHEIDTGNILMQKAVDISESDTAGELHDKLKMLGASVLLDTLQGLFSGSLTEKPQDAVLPSGPLRHAPKIFAETCRIQWDQPARDVYNLVRGLSPHPGAFTEWHGKMLKVFGAGVLPVTATPPEPPGSFLTDGKTYLRVACSDGLLDITDCQLEGKKRMKTVELLRGYRP